VSIVLQRVSKAFAGVPAVIEVDEEISDGSLVALLGPSGCGKTTLLRIIAGLEYPDSGRIFIDGVEITDLALRKRNVGFVFQSYALFPHLDVAANIGFGLSVRGMSKAAVKERTRELLSLVQLDGYERRKPHQLSGGQRQRVALARALAAEPKILLLDEPFAALDLQVRKDLRRWLRALHEQTHVTTLIVTHDADEAMEISDRLVLMRHGRVQQAGAPGDVYREPSNPFVMQFLGAVNVLRNGGAESLYVRPHDFALAEQPFEHSHEARVERVLSLGALTRIECRLHDGQIVTTELPGDRAHALAPSVGKTVHLAPTRSRPFATIHA
jgi:sulfate/thiosulfate transport system ATP-binding protein